MPERFTAEEKMKAAEREVGFRKRVFARRVSEGRMSQEKADLEIALMEEIANDYRKLAEGERLI